MAAQIIQPSCQKNAVVASKAIIGAASECASAAMSKDDDNNESAQGDAAAAVANVPAAVLQYERQLRKAQHAKKAGATLDPNMLYLDESIVVINKLPGVLTMPGIRSNCSILDLVHAAYGDECSANPATMILHRLDMDTSGIALLDDNPPRPNDCIKSFVIISTPLSPL